MIGDGWATPSRGGNGWAEWGRRRLRREWEQEGWELIAISRGMMSGEGEDRVDLIQRDELEEDVDMDMEVGRDWVEEEGIGTSLNSAQACRDSERDGGGGRTLILGRDFKLKQGVGRGRRIVKPRRKGAEKKNEENRVKREMEKASFLRLWSAGARRSKIEHGDETGIGTELERDLGLEE